MKIDTIEYHVDNTAHRGSFIAERKKKISIAVVVGLQLAAIIKYLFSKVVAANHTTHEPENGFKAIVLTILTMAIFFILKSC